MDIKVQFIYFKDYLLLPFYIIGAIILMNIYFKSKHGNNLGLKKYFNWGFYLKLFGCLSISLIYQYYYGGTYDGVHYFSGAKMLGSYWLKYPGEFFPVLFQDIDTFNETNKAGLHGEDVHIFANESFTVSKIAAIFNYFSFNSFLPCSFFFFLSAFIGLWNFFIFIIREFDIPVKAAAFSSLFIPSVLVWGSGIFKDTVTFTALLWLFMCSYYVFIKKRNLIKNILGIIVSIIIIYFIKSYIIAAFTPFFIIYIVNSNKGQIKNSFIRYLSTPFMVLILVGALMLFTQYAGDLFGRYSVDKVLETASQTASHIKEYQAGSSYSINVDFSSPLGIILAIPPAINITLFRPYPWEYLNPFILFASIESMFFLYFTLYLIFRGGFSKSLRIIWNSPLLQFIVLFSFTFAFMVGVSSGNFGTLVRYKIPIMPFYLLFLSVLYREKFLLPRKNKIIKQKLQQFAQVTKVER